jgi:hypothetical protein
VTGGAQESEMQLEMSRKEGALPLGLLEDDLRNGGLFWTKCVKQTCSSILSLLFNYMFGFKPKLYKRPWLWEVPLFWHMHIPNKSS